MQGAVMALLLAGLVITSSGYTNVSGRRCVTYTELGDGYDHYFAVGYRTNEMLDIVFDESTTGAASTQTLDLQYCTLETTESCANYDFDTTGNGLGDTNRLLDDGVKIETGGVRGISGFNFLRVTETGEYEETASFTICRRRV